MELVCRRCHRSVRVGAAEYETFERMHYVCFHYEFEHQDFDVDESCRLAGCPSEANGSGRRTVIATARALATAAAADDPWSNRSLHEYLEALARWLENSDAYYRNDADRRTTPPDGWTVVDDALRAAATHE